MSKSRIYRMLTILSVCLASIGALYMLGRRLTDLHMGFLYDEMYTLATAHPGHPFPFLWREMLLKDVNPPSITYCSTGGTTWPNLPWCGCGCLACWPACSRWR